MSTTVIIPTKNEVNNIEAVIASVSFADEILVVDSFSTDGTVEKAMNLGAKILQRTFDYHAAQKNWAIPQAKHDWILLVDADERVTPELKKEIISVLQQKEIKEKAFWIKRINHFMGQRVHYSGWRNDAVIRLFDKKYSRYEDIFVHEEIICTGTTGKLKHKLSHNTYKNFDAYIQKMNRYATQQAKVYDLKTGKITPYHLVLKPFWGFFKHYIVQSGFRDGFVGFTFFGFCLGTQYTVFIDLPFISPCIAFALFKPIFISLSGVSSSSSRSANCGNVTGVPSPFRTPVFPFC